MKLLKWLDNYWYHYKWQTLIALFLIVFFAVTIPQLVTKIDDDVTLLYAGPISPGSDETREMTSALQTIMTDDYNGDGVKQVGINSILLMTQEQLDDATANADTNGEFVMYNQQTLLNNRTKFSTQLFAGEAVICLLDPNWFKDAYEAGGFVPLAEILGYTPENAYNDSAVYLKDTRFYGYFSVFSAFPEDTLLCIRRMSTATVFKNTEKENARYAQQVEMFKAMMNYTLEG